MLPSSFKQYKIRHLPFSFYGSMIIVAWLMFAPGCSGSAKPTPKDSTKKVEVDSDEAMVDLESMRPQVESFCGACHAAPRPESFPKDAWFAEVQRGYEFYERSRRTDLTSPPLQDVVRYYRQQAPVALQIPAPKAAISDPPFTAANLELGSEPTFPAVSHLAVGDGYLVQCDMQLGEVRRLELNGATVTADSLMARVPHPAHAVACDLDRDGKQDWIVADLGSFQPADHKLGQVLWLKNVGEEFQTIVLQKDVGRIADVRPADFDKDGDLDLVVAEFGWHETGSVYWLEQTAPGAAGGDLAPKFEMHRLDPRPGAIHVPVADLNGDGWLDFVALISQEHEVAVAFMNQHDGTFTKELIFDSLDPAFGSSGIELVDLDGDKDLDVLYTNGDMLDSFYAKPYHAVHWLKNNGSFPFEHHELTKLPGAMRAMAADIDRDGDQDVVACAFIPSRIRGVESASQETLILLEQHDGAFQHRVLERSSLGHMTLMTGDFNGDDRPDVAVGNFGSKPMPGQNWSTIWFGK